MAERKKEDVQEETGPEARAEGRGYLAETRRLGMSVLAMLPLVVIYQVGIVQSRAGVRNIAEVWLTGPFSLLGVHAATAVNILVMAGLLVALWRLERTGAVCFSFLFIMVLEAVIYATVMFLTAGAVARFVQRHVVDMLSAGNASWSSLWLSVGAGVYEELLFRLILLAGGVFVLHRVFQFRKTPSMALMLVISSLAFSAAHHVGALGEAPDGFVFIFRTVCGLMLGIVFLTRGLGVAAWMHALYNVLVLMVYGEA